MKKNLDNGMSYEKAHNKAVKDGFPAKKPLNIGKSLHSQKKKGELIEAPVKKYAKGGIVKIDEGGRVEQNKNDSILDTLNTSARASNNISKHLYQTKVVRAKGFPNSPAFNYELNGGYNLKSGVAFSGLRTAGVPKMKQTPYLDGNYFDGKESGMRQYDKGLRSQIQKEKLGATQERTNNAYNISGRHKQDKAYNLVQTDRNIGYFKKNKVHKHKCVMKKGLDYREFNKWYIMDYANAMNGFRKKGVNNVLNKVIQQRVRHSIDTLGNNLQGDRGGFFSSGFRAQQNLSKVIKDDGNEPQRIILDEGGDEVETYDAYGDVNNYLPIKSNANIWKNNRDVRMNKNNSGGVGDYDRLSRRVFTNDFLKTGKVSSEN